MNFNIHLGFACKFKIQKFNEDVNLSIKNANLLAKKLAKKFFGEAEGFDRIFPDYDDDEKMFFIIFPNSEPNFWFYMKEYSFKKPVNFDYIFSNFDFTCFD